MGSKKPRRSTQPNVAIPARGDRRKPSRQCVVAIALLAGIATLFWSQSRYPQLDDKGLMGTRAVLDGIAFAQDVIVSVEASAPFYVQWAADFVNWGNTNKNGMLFGLLFAGAILTLLSTLRRKQNGNRFVNILTGMLTGAPLGVCVNCATPIAHGMISSGVRLETALATLISSPTLNIIVVSMLFTMFPLHFAVAKILATVLFVVLIVPLAIRFVYGGEETLLDGATERAVQDSGRIGRLLQRNQQQDPEMCSVGNPAESSSGADTWLDAIRAVAWQFCGNVVAVSKITLPFMALAGVFGVILVDVVPLDVLKDTTPSLISTVVVAVVGTLLPVPIAFDVILVAILMQIGLQPIFAMVLLFTLGTFSIYPYLVLGSNVSYRMATALLVSCVVIGCGSGTLVQEYNDYLVEEMLDAHERFMAERPSGQTPPPIHAAANPFSVDINRNALRVHHLPYTEVHRQSRVRVLEAPMLQSADDGQPGAMRKQQIYRNEVLNLDLYNHNNLVSMLGVVNLDGDDTREVVAVRSEDVGIFQYREGSLVEVGHITFPNQLKKSVLFPVDLNMDGYTDFLTNIKATTHDAAKTDGLTLYLNNRDYTFKSVEVPGLRDQPFYRSAGFALANDDEFVDIVLGGWNTELDILTAVDQTSANYIYYAAPSNDYQAGIADFRAEDLDASMRTHAATLSVVFSDIFKTSKPNLLVGNDFSQPDVFYEKVDGRWLPWRGYEKRVEAGSVNTMSILTGDVNNDGLIDIFTTDMMAAADSDVDVCSGIQSRADRETCSISFRVQTAIRENDLASCFELIDIPDFENTCVDTIILNLARDHWDEDICERIDKQNIRRHCVSLIRRNKKRKKFFSQSGPAMNRFIPQRWSNVMLMQGEDGRFLDQAETLGLARTDWSWTSTLFDINNDSFQDLLVVNGSHVFPRLTPNRLLVNDGQSFAFAEKKYGMGDIANTFNAVAFDADLDGDQDVVVLGAVQHLAFYENQQGGEAIAFEVLHRGRRNIPNALVQIYYGNQTQIREITIGGGFLSFSSTRLHFGLGGETAIDRVEVVLPWHEVIRIDKPMRSGHVYRIEIDGAEP